MYQNCDTPRQVTVRPCGDRKTHADLACKIATLPESNRDYWLSKLEPNAARDAQCTAKLNNSGWEVLILLECEVEGDNLQTRFVGRPTAVPYRPSA